MKAHLSNLQPEDVGIGRLFDSVRDAVILADTETQQIVLWNPAATKIFGYSTSEALELRVEALVPEYLKARHRTGMTRYGETGQGAYVDSHKLLTLPALTKSGEQIWIELSLSPIRNVPDLDDRRYVLAIIRDITERKRAEEQLAYHASLLENVHDAVVATDERFVVTAWNRGAEEMYGWTADEALGRRVREVLPSELTDEQRAEALRRLAETGRFSTEVNMYRKDGTPICIEGNTVVLRDEQGQITGYLSINRDITKRKQAEKEIEIRVRQQAAVRELGLRALEEVDLSLLMQESVALTAEVLDVKLCSILKYLPDKESFLVEAGVGWGGQFLRRVLPATGMDTHAGYTLRSREPVLIEDLRAEHRFRADPQMLKHGVVSGISVVIPHRDGPFGVLGAHTVSRRTFTEKDVNFLQTVANVLATAVECKRSEEEMQEIRKAERRRISRDLHDEALQDLLYALQQMRRTQAKSKQGSQHGEDEHEEEKIEALERGILGLRGAIYNLRLGGENGEQKLAEMLESLVELNRQSSPGYRIELSVEESFPPLTKLSEIELLRIVQEALTNVRRHSEANFVRVAVGVSGDKLWAEVVDNGRGFDPNAPTGMGAKGMRERARQLGGDLKITSKPGEGTKVRFEMALERILNEPRLNEPQVARILLVEDHASFRQTLASELEQEPEFIVVGQAASLAEAREMLHGIDVAIIDLTLSDGYGGDLMKELQSANPRAKALVLSGNLSRVEMAKAIESGAAGALHKSASVDEIKDAVRRLQAGESLLPLEEVVDLLRLANSQRAQQNEARHAIESLTPREKEVLQALAEGLDCQEIAEKLNITVGTERNHMASILSKLGVNSRVQALVFALRHNLVSVYSQGFARERRRPPQST